MYHHIFFSHIHASYKSILLACKQPNRYCITLIYPLLNRTKHTINIVETKRCFIPECYSHSSFFLFNHRIYVLVSFLVLVFIFFWLIFVFLVSHLNIICFDLLGICDEFHLELFAQFGHKHLFTTHR